MADAPVLPVSVLVTIMMATGSYLPSLLMMTQPCAGCSNSLIAKFQDLRQLRPPHDNEHFEQPVLQTIDMFIGECLCLAALYASRCIWCRYKLRARSANNRRGQYDAISSDEEIPGNGRSSPTIVIDTSALQEHSPTKIPPKQPSRSPIWLACPALCDIVGTTVGHQLIQDS